MGLELLAFGIGEANIGKHVADVFWKVMRLRFLLTIVLLTPPFPECFGFFYAFGPPLID